MTDSLDVALLDVRKAYRLLADYQQRIIELLAFIRNELAAEHYSQVGRQSVPRSIVGLENTNNAGLRFLPFFDLSVLLLKHSGQNDPYANHRPGDLLIDLYVHSDTARSLHLDGDPATPPDASTSELGCYFFVCDQPAADGSPADWQSQIWNRSDYPGYGQVLVTNFPQGSYRAYSDRIALNKLGSEEAIRLEIAALKLRVSQSLDHEFWSRDA